MNAAQESLAISLRTAWNELPEEEKARHRPYIERGHQQFMNFKTFSVIDEDTEDDIAEEFLLVKSVLNENDEDLAEKAFEFLDNIGAVMYVDSTGRPWRSRKFGTLDPGWLESFVVYLKHLRDKHGFPQGTPDTIPIPDNVRISIAGDWGTGNWGTATDPAASTKIISAISSQAPDYTIHLGDVYYSGAKHEEKENLIDIWPNGSKGAFTLNSNHEMYSGGYPYFDDAVGGSFTMQKGFSYFALENSNWIIVGLDSAYFDRSVLFHKGTLGAGSSQVQFLKAQTAKGKKIILLSHHNGLKDRKNGTQRKNDPLWSQVMDCFPAGTVPAYWFWGHIHTGAVYAQQAAFHNVRCRCIGHGAIPKGVATELQKAQNNGTVLWFEKTNAQDNDNVFRVYNGFATIELNGAQVKETVYNENGQVSWQS